MIAVAIITLAGGVWSLPFAQVPNDYNTPPEPVFSNALTNLSPYLSDNVSVNVALRANGPEVAIGIPMNLQVYFPTQPLKDATSFSAIPDNALAYNETAQKLIYQYATIPITIQSGYWQGQLWIEYYASGTFGITFVFNQGVEIVGRIHSGPFYTIGSQDLIAAKYNAALTTSLTLFILMFAALDVRIDEDRYKPNGHK